MKVLPQELLDEPFCPLDSAFIRRDLSLLEVLTWEQLLSGREDGKVSYCDCKGTIDVCIMIGRLSE
jgi:hypothetical protein